MPVILETIPYKTAVVWPLTSHHTVQVRRARHVRYCWRSNNKFISDVLLWTPNHRHTSVRWPARIYFNQHCADSCHLDRDGWWEWVKGTHSVEKPWWWWILKIIAGEFVLHWIFCYFNNHYFYNLFQPGPVQWQRWIVFFNWNHFEIRLLNLRIYFIFLFFLSIADFFFGARGTADRGVESLQFQMSIVRR